MAKERHVNNVKGNCSVSRNGMKKAAAIYHKQRRRKQKYGIKMATRKSGISIVMVERKKRNENMKQ